MSVQLQSNLNELDYLLADLSSSNYIINNSKNFTDYSDDYFGEEKCPDRPPLPPEYMNTKKDESKPSTAALAFKKPRRPPKLMHVLKDGERKRVHDLAKDDREDYFMDVEVEIQDDGTDYGDYSSKWEYLGKGIWENQDSGASVSNYSTLKSNVREDYDYSTMSKSPLPNISDVELEKETGAGPRGERSKIIPTDHGEIKSKYNYLGFGLWENTDPAPKPKKPDPPPIPPKAEPVWYNATVQVTTSLSSKELDDLVMKNFTVVSNKQVELSNSAEVDHVDEPYDINEKEDMSDMFRRAMFEKMQMTDDLHAAKYNCFKCKKLIVGVVITALGKKFHSECFVCNYCRQEFKDRKFKTDPKDNLPYCYLCFEKLLGHYGTARGQN